MGDDIGFITRVIQPIMSLSIEDQNVLESIYNEMATMEPVDDQTIALEASDPFLQLSELQQQLVTNASDLSRRPSFAT